MATRACAGATNCTSSDPWPAWPMVASGVIFVDVALRSGPGNPVPATGLCGAPEARSGKLLLPRSIVSQKRNGAADPWSSVRVSRVHAVLCRVQDGCLFWGCGPLLAPGFQSRALALPSRSSSLSQGAHGLLP